MAAGQGQKIEALDYNNIRNIINPVISRNFGGTADVGYDNSPSAGLVAADSKISATQWNNLRSDISRCRGHQTGTNLLDSGTAGALTVPNPSAQFTATITGGSGTTLAVSVIASGTIQVGSVLSGQAIPANTYTITAQTSGTAGSTGNYTVTPPLSIPSAQTVVSTYYRQISENDRALYTTMAQAAVAGRIITPPASIPAIRRTQANLVPNKVRPDVLNNGGWNGIISQTITITFPQEVSATNPTATGTTARAYFNSGSQFLFSALFTPFNGESKNVSWQTLCSNMGIIRFGINSISDSGNTSASIATIAAYGFTNLPASLTLLYTRTITYSATAGEVGNYNPNRIKLYGRKSTSPGFDIFTFVFEFEDAAVADTPPASVNPNDTPQDEDVNGTLTTTIQAEYANAPEYITVIPPTGATTEIA
jgi:hypothetical protein